MMAARRMVHLLVAHPRHELLLHGSISRNKPVVHVREERVAAGNYATVMRKREHMLPLRDALLAAVEKRSCAF
jgi:hypothetical protein